MFVFRTTTATDAHAWRVSVTESGQTIYSTNNTGVDFLQRTVSTSLTLASRWESPYGTTRSSVTRETREETLTQENHLGSTTSATQSVSAAVTSRFTIDQFLTSISNNTENSLGVTVGTAATTTTRTFDSYRSTTITETTTAALETTTTRTTTRSIVTTAAGPTTTTTSQATTQTTSTSAAGAITRTTYGVSLSGAISAPVSLVDVSVAEATEQAWDVTATTRSAGYPSHVASTFDRRTATLTTSTAQQTPVGTSETFSTTCETTTAARTLTLTTTHTLTTADTFVPFASVYPATDTTTRSFSLLSTSTFSTVAGLAWTTSSITTSGRASLQNTAASTVAEVFADVVPVTINVSPTGTTAASFHITRTATTTRASLRPQLLGTSQSSSAFASGSTAFNTNTLTLVPKTLTGTSTIFAASQFATETCSVASGTETAFTSGQVSPGYSTLELYSTIHSASGVTITTTGYVGSETTVIGGFGSPDRSGTDSESELVGGVSYSYYSTFTIAAGFGTFTIETYTGSTFSILSGTHTLITESWYLTEYTYTSGLEEVSTTRNVTTGSTSASSYTDETAASFTVPQLHAQTTADAWAAWSAHQMHPRQGFAHPLSLGATNARFSAMSVNPSTPVYFPPAGTQDDVAGPITPKVGPLSKSTAGASIYSAAWRSSASVLEWSSATTATFSTTERNGSASTTTVTRTSTGASNSGTASFSGVGSLSWYSPGISSAASAGFRIGGLATRAEYAARAYIPAGVRHSTRQEGGTSSTSETTEGTVATVSTVASHGYAFPTRNESAYAVTLSETRFAWEYSLSSVSLTGQTARPAITASLNPNL